VDFSNSSYYVYGYAGQWALLVKGYRARKQ